MKTYEVTFENGEKGETRRLDCGDFACPVCGTPGSSPVFFPSGKDAEEILPLFTTMPGDVCGGCRTEFGVELIDMPTTEVGRMRVLIAFFRRRWLDDIGWTPAALEQLKANLDVSREQLEREGQELREIGWLK